jgi:hypothetical protein
VILLIFQPILAVIFILFGLALWGLGFLLGVVIMAAWSAIEGARLAWHALRGSR